MNEILGPEIYSVLTKNDDAAISQWITSVFIRSLTNPLNQHKYLKTIWLPIGYHGYFF